MRHNTHSVKDVLVGSLPTSKIFGGTPDWVDDDTEDIAPDGQDTEAQLIREHATAAKQAAAAAEQAAAEQAAARRVAA